MALDKAALSDWLQRTVSESYGARASWGGQPLVTVKIYVEGGVDTRYLRVQCRQGFSDFFRKTGLEGHMPRIVVSGGRQQAFDDFCTAPGNAGAVDFVVLLVDREAPVTAGSVPWTHLDQYYDWTKPAKATDDNAHLMTQCMEAWFLADKNALAEFFGNEFRPGSLPANLNIQDIPKTDVLDGLKAATRQCVKKGEYGKGRHSFKILAKIGPTGVTNASPHAKRLVDTLIQKAGI